MAEHEANSNGSVSHDDISNQVPLSIFLRTLPELPSDPSDLHAVFPQRRLNVLATALGMESERRNKGKPVDPLPEEMADAVGQLRARLPLPAHGLIVEEPPASPASTSTQPAEYSNLSPREREFYELFRITTDPNEIARQLGISVASVKSYKSIVLRKLGLPTKQQTAPRESYNAPRKPGKTYDSSDDEEFRRRESSILVGANLGKEYREAYEKAPITQTGNETDPNSSLSAREVYDVLTLLRSNSDAAKRLTPMVFDDIPREIRHAIDNVLEELEKTPVGRTDERYYHQIVDRTLQYVKIKGYPLRHQAFDVPSQIRLEAYAVIDWLHAEWKKAHATTS